MGSQQHRSSDFSSRLALWSCLSLFSRRPVKDARRMDRRTPPFRAGRRRAQDADSGLSTRARSAATATTSIPFCLTEKRRWLAVGRQGPIPGVSESDQELIGRELLAHVEKLRSLRPDIAPGVRSLGAGRGRVLDIEEVISRARGGSRLPHEITLADFEPDMPKDRVSGGDVEVKVRHRKV